MDNLNQHQKPKTKNIETYASDMSEAIMEGGGGVVKDIIHAQEAEEEHKKKYSPESTRNQLFTVVGVVFIFAAVGVLLFLKNLDRAGQGVEVSPGFVPLIFTEQSEFVPIDGLSKDQLEESVRLRAETLEISPDSVASVYLAEDKKVIGFGQFLERIGADFPSAGKEMVQVNFFIGVLGGESSGENPESSEVFFILKTRSFVDIFPVLREWEKKMFYDLYGFFHKSDDFRIPALTQSLFEDGFVLNKNARFLYDETGTSALIYVFADENSVVISASREAAEEALRRLSAGEIRK